GVVSAQQTFYNSQFAFEPTMYTQPPQIGKLTVTIPDEARKNGVEGTAKVSFTLGADGKIHDALIVDDLPSGVGEALRKAVEQMQFTPASLSGRPVEMKGSIAYTISTVYD